jgi:intracellular multiplication protein IcmK
MKFNKILIISMMACTVNNINAENDSSKQALEQLKILQQKLSSDKNTENSINATPKSQTNAALPSIEDTKFRPQQNNLQDNVADNDEAIIEEQAFNSLLHEMYPLSKKNLHDLHKKYNEQELNTVATPETPPKPTASSQKVNLAPGSTPPVIRLAQGFVSSLVFLDSTGAPWDIVSYDIGDPSSFNIQWDKSSNTLMIQAMKLYTYGNMAVRLKNLNTPVMLTLIPGQKVVDYRIDMRVEGYGPNAAMGQDSSGLPDTANDLLMHVLEGVPPAGSEQLSVLGGDAQAWLLNNKMYIRTNLSILSPGWLASMTSADGMHAYEIQRSPVLLVSWHGKVMQLKIEGL